MARVLIASDGFNRAGPAPGADWAQLNVALGGGVQIVGSTQIAGTVAGVQAAARWVGAGAFGADQYSSIVLPSGDQNSASYAIGAIARASGDTDGARDYYYVFVSSATVFGKVVNGTDTIFVSDGAPSWPDGDRVELECEGTTIRVMRNGVAMGGAFTVTDASISNGQPGIIALGDPGITSGDDWEGGNLGLPPPVPSNFVPRRSMKIWAYA